MVTLSELGGNDTTRNRVIQLAGQRLSEIIDKKGLPITIRHILNKEELCIVVNDGERGITFQASDDDLYKFSQEQIRLEWLEKGNKIETTK